MDQDDNDDRTEMMMILLLFEWNECRAMKQRQKQGGKKKVK